MRKDTSKKTKNKPTNATADRAQQQKKPFRVLYFRLGESISFEKVYEKTNDSGAFESEGPQQ